MQDCNSGKVLLIGNCEAGKTSMRSIIFANYEAKETKLLSATYILLAYSSNYFPNEYMILIKFKSNFLAIFQERFLNDLFTKKSKDVFSDVSMMLFVFDVASEQYEMDWKIYQQAMEKLGIYSPNSLVYVLVHKMDKIPSDMKRSKLDFYTEKAKSMSNGKPIRVFGTSIWDETLYLAWSNVIQSLVPDSQKLQQQLNSLAEFTECDELVLFERNTFLVLANSDNSLSLDPFRFEKISNTIKQFKLVTTKYRSSYDGFTIRDGKTIICMKPFTEFTSMMVVSSSERTSLTRFDI
ncbi:hypothetical protein JH06_1809 [Blastocystis sp. subtype 4]|uniref:hypothetical protein n=1 Tax=Blastocystis sp. subtype 4 TaxID=944170 RepID=UPI000711F5E2|nr:hypothetical protein JH06_1809 [Blastocystis sp. subtype 4]KNB45593.1 hypothetical protein JH06_1809 [Blastocystis sp. subtype 4]|eukprot:XP_014529033.1 hypothetical protein JH06_1809 [Blastocystis sp. subtype 4]